jgi:short-subunit dehydrogenase
MVAVVTGAASGIGRATAILLANRGCGLALVDVDTSGLDETAARCRARGQNVSVHRVDVADRAQMEVLPAAVIAQHSHVELVFNNAGVALDGTIEELSLDDIRWLVDINLWGVIYGCKFFLPLLRQRPQAHIVNVSSVFGIIGVPRNGPYCATKFAVRGWSESLWTELHGSNIGVTVVHPGGIRTNIARNARVVDRSSHGTFMQEFEKVARTTPEHAAAKILQAVERNRMRLRICPETLVLDWLKRLLPTGVQALIARMAAGAVAGPLSRKR